jgi:hypothetical protein
MNLHKQLNGTNLTFQENHLSYHNFQNIQQYNEESSIRMDDYLGESKDDDGKLK